MKYVIFSDLHFGSTTIDDLKQSTNFIIEYLTKEQDNVQHVFCLGDTLNEAKRIEPKALDAACRFFNDIITVLPRAHLHILIGNHDMIEPKTMEHHAFSSLERIKRERIHIYSEITYIKELDIVMIPYLHDQRKLKEWVMLNQSCLTKETKGFAHLRLSGAVATGLSYSTSHIHYEPNEAQCISPSYLISVFEETYTGHWHEYQTFAHEKVMVVSSLIQIKSNETGRHGFIVYDTVQRKHQFVDNPFAKRFWDVHYLDVKRELTPHTYQDHQLVKIRHEFDTPKEELQSALDYVRSLGVTKVKTYMTRVMIPDTTRPQQEENKDNMVTSNLVNPQAFDIQERISTFVGPHNNEFWNSMTRNQVIDSIKDVIQQVNQNITNMSTNMSTKLIDLNFETIKMTNFMGINGSTTFSIKDLQKDGVYVLESGNGSGKSILIEAIVWTFFDTTIRDLVKSKVANTPKLPVEVEIVLNDGNLIISRQRLDTTSSKMQYNRFSVVNKDNKVLCSDKDEFVNQFLGVNSAQQFISTMMLATQKSRGFLHAKPSERQEILEQMMGFDNLKTYQDIMTQWLSSYESRKQVFTKFTQLQADVLKSEATLSEIERSTNEHETKLQNLQASTNSTTITTIGASSLQMEMDTVKNNFTIARDELQHSIDCNKVEFQTLDPKIETVKKTIIQSQTNQALRLNELVTLNEKVKNPEKQHIQHVIDDFVNGPVFTGLKFDIEKIRTTFPDQSSIEQFDSIEQFLTQTLPHAISGEDKSLISRCESQLRILDSQLLEQQFALQNLVSKHTELTEEKRRLKSALQLLERDVNINLKKIQDKINLENESIIRREEQIKSTKELLVHWKRQLTSQETSCKALMIKSTQYEKQYWTIPISDDDTIKASTYSFWLDMLNPTPTLNQPHLGAFRRFLRQSIIQNINNNLNQTIQELSHSDTNRDIRLSLSCDLLLQIHVYGSPSRNENNETEQHDYMYSKKSTQKDSLGERQTLSFGESLKLELAIFFIMFQSLSYSTKQAKPNVLFLDECLTGFDDQTMNQVIQYLKFGLLSRTPSLKHIVILNAFTLPLQVQQYLNGTIQALPSEANFMTKSSSVKTTTKSKSKKIVVADVVPTGHVWSKYIITHY